MKNVQCEECISNAYFLDDEVICSKCKNHLSNSNALYIRNTFEIVSPPRDFLNDKPSICDTCKCDAYPKCTSVCILWCDIKMTSEDK